MKQYNEQKLHMMNADIPKEDKDNYLILKKASDCLSVDPKDFHKIHPYCLELSITIAENLSEKSQLNCTEEQIVFIPPVALSYFSMNFFDKWEEKQWGKDIKVIEHFKKRHEDGTITYEQEEVLVSDRLLIAKSQKLFREDVLERKRLIRSRVNEPKWLETNQISIRDLVECLDMSPKGIKTEFSECILKEPANTLDYKMVLEHIQSCISIPNFELLSKECKEELDTLGGVETDGAFILKRLPILYQGKELLRQLGFITTKNKNKISEKVRIEAEEKQVTLHFKNLQSRGYRYLKSTILALNNDKQIQYYREKNNQKCDVPNPKTCFFDY